MKYLCILVLCIGVIPAAAQADFEPVDRIAVEKAIKNSAADSYYPVLLKQFQHFDSTLSLEAYRLLYYGFVFHKNYMGYPDQQKEAIVKALDAKEYALVLKLCDIVLEKFPVSLTANYFKGLALYYNNEKDSSYTKYRARYYGLTEAIVSSGDGLSCETAFKTIFVSDEYEIMYKYFEIKEHLGQSLAYPCDRLTVSPSVYFKADTMYFDASETLLSVR